MVRHMVCWNYKDALAKYQVHEEHKKMGQYIGSVTQNRYCIDYIEK